MIECIIAVALIIYGLESGDTRCFMAAGLFAVACNIQAIRDDGTKDE